MTDFIPYPNNQGGAIPDKYDGRDYIIDEVLGATEVALPERYDITQKIDGLKIETQMSSLSCVAQSWAYYAEVLERIENTDYTNLSAKFLYSRIFLPQGGAQIRDGAKIMEQLGIAEEDVVPSHDTQGLTSEEFMRQVDNSPQILENASIRRIKGYGSIWHNHNVQLIKKAIYLNHGCVGGFYGDNVNWSNYEGKPKGVVMPPVNTDPNLIWGHGVYLCGWDIIAGIEMIKFLNSWGEGWGDNGYGYIHPSYWTNFDAFSVWTAVDLPNIIKEKIKQNVMMDEELLSLLYRGIFKREPDEGAKGYLGQPVKEVVRLLLDSEENKIYTPFYQAGKSLEEWARK